MLKPEVPLGLLLLHDAHDLGLAEDGARRVQLTELSHLEHNLLVQVLELLARQLELRNLGQHSVPAPGIDVGDEGVDAVDGVERDLALVLQRLERLLQRVLLAELQHYLHHVAGLDLEGGRRRRHLRLLRAAAAAAGGERRPEDGRRWGSGGDCRIVASATGSRQLLG